MALRLSAVFILLLSVVFLPFWVSAALALAGMAYFRIFWEAAVLMLLSDILYGASVAKFGGFVFVSFFASVVILMIVEMLKTKIKFYP